MKINGLFYLLFGAILGALIAVMLVNVNEITAKENSSNGLELASLQAPQYPVPFTSGTEPVAVTL